MVNSRPASVMDDMKAKSFIGTFALLGLIGPCIWVVMTEYYSGPNIPLKTGQQFDPYIHSDVIFYTLWPSEWLIIQSLKFRQQFDLFTVYTVLSIASNVLLYTLVGLLVWVGLHKNKAAWLLLIVLAVILYGAAYYSICGFCPHQDIN
jgi:hypothetical protein